MEKRSRAIYWLTRVPLILAALVVLLLSLIHIW